MAERREDVAERRDGGLLDVVRVLLLLQGAILVATTIEAAIWGLAFRSGLAPLVLSGAAAVALLAARARLREGARRPRRIVLAVEAVILAAFVVDTALAVAVRGAVPPAVAVVTRLVVPLAVIVLLRRTARAGAPAPAAAGSGA